jgi:ATP-dependent Lon protease
MVLINVVISWKMQRNTRRMCIWFDGAKMQIMQMIGQWITNPDALGTAIAIKGPPGTGKTSW